MNSTELKIKKEKGKKSAFKSFLFNFSFLIFNSILLATSVHAIERRPGSIKTSDGLEMKGEVWFNNGEAKIYEGEDSSGGRFIRIMQSEMVSITFAIKTSTMEKPWRFKNAGSDEKEYLDGQYPVVELKSEVKLKSGQILKGHLQAAPVMVRIQSRENAMDWDTKKFFVKYQYKGEVGQTQKDVEYVTAITFDDIGGVVTSAKGIIAGTLKGHGKIEQASAYGIKRGRAYEGKPGKDPETFRIDNLPEDTYDVVILTDSGIFAGLSEEAAVKNEDARALEPGDLDAMNEKIKHFNDFFDDQHALLVKGNREAAKVLVMQRRKNPIYDNESLKGKELQRVDIWNWHMRQTEWVIDQSSRANMLRYTDSKEKKREITLVEKLGAITVGSETKTIEVNAAEAAGKVLKP